MRSGQKAHERRPFQRHLRRRHPRVRTRRVARQVKQIRIAVNFKPCEWCERATDCTEREECFCDGWSVDSNDDAYNDPRRGLAEDLNRKLA